MSAKAGLRSALNTVGEAQRRFARSRGNSLSTIPPKEEADDYIPGLAACAASILYRSPKPSPEGRPLYILNAAAFPDSFDVDYDSLLSYVLDRLPKEDELLSGTEYEIVFFAGGQPEGATTEKKNGPGVGWYIRAYEVLSRALRKKLQRLYIVHPRTWVRVLLGAFSTIVSPKFRRKLIHVNTLTALAEYIPVEQLLIPPSVYVQDRRVKPEIYVTYATGRRAFGARHPLPKNIDTGETRLPRVLRETSKFMLMGDNIDTEGLFRIPPNAVLNGVLKEAYDRGQRWIVWKGRDATLCEPGLDSKLLSYVKLEDAYPVHQAAALIKVWYRELREPIVPEASYETLKAKYDAHDTKVTAEDLVDLLLPRSDRSPLSSNSRSILTRHLLPLLSEVACHGSSNKMNSENLAIVFSMCMVCGSNQMEDAKVANTVVKKILVAAIDMWPQLREGMGVLRDNFLTELEPPKDLRDYEDPFDEPRPSRSQRLSEDDVVEANEGHRINLEDFETGIIERAPTLPPALPPRSQQRPASAMSSNESSEQGHHPPAIPKRKPAPHHTEAAPPRYSTVFDADGHSLQAESPATYAPANGFGPRRHGNWSLDEDMKKGFAPLDVPLPTDPHPALGVPKRKAVSGEHKIPTSAQPAADSAPTSAIEPSSAVPEPTRSASDTKALATLAAQKAASSLGSHLDAAFTAPRVQPSADVVQSPEAVSASSEPNENVFRKPSWPASARPQPGWTKPSLPARPNQSQTVPIINQPTPTPSNGLASREGVPKVRAPSPGLLKRMSDMESAGSTSSTSSASLPPCKWTSGSSATTSGGGDGASEQQQRLQPRKLNLRKQSVEDLRRLYEERNSVAESLGRAEASRRKSSS